MSLLRLLQLFSALAATGVLVATYALASHWRWTPVIVAAFLASWYARRFAPVAASSASAAALILAAVVGLWSGIGLLHALPVVALALAAWDLAAFENRMQSSDADMQRLLKPHATKLGIVIAAGVVAAGSARLLTLRLDFWLVFALSLLMAFSLSRALSLLKQ